MQRLFARKKRCILQKTHMKLGLIIAMVCLFLVAGTFTSGTASAHTDQSSKRFRNWFVQAPHITVKLLSASGRHSKNAYAGRAVIYGVGFRANNGYGPCDSCGTSSTPSITTTTTSTTTSTTTFSPTTTTCSSSCGSAPTAPSAPAGPSDQPSTSTTCYSACGGNAPVGPSDQPGTTCPSACGNSAPAGPSDQPGTSTTCYSACGGNAPVGPSDQPGATCPSDCGNSAPVGPSTQPSTTCYTTCGSPAPVGPSDQPGSDCGCNTVNIQSSAPISAYAPGINLTRVPVNAFGEFRVIVNVRPPVRHYTVPTIWAVNTYNDQPSNYAPMCYCG
jgi:hypothetical protein